VTSDRATRPRATRGRPAADGPAFGLIRPWVSGFIDARQIDKISPGGHVEIPVIHVFTISAGGVLWTAADGL